MDHPPPFVTVETRTAPLGSTVVVECQTNLETPITYSWSKRGSDLSSNTEVLGSQLTIKDIRGVDGGTYVCTAENPYGTSIDIPTNLIVTGIIPYFNQIPGHPASYIKMSTLSNSYKKFDIELSVRPDDLDGLILYNGQNGRSGDFLSLGLKNGHVEFRFELGSGTLVLKSSVPIQLGNWTTIRIRRDRNHGHLSVSGQNDINATSAGQFVGLDLAEPLFIGSVPDFSRISKSSGGYGHGFSGCLSFFKTGLISHDLMRESLGNFGISSCDSCSLDKNPCKNGLCQESLTSTGSTCICYPGFYGTFCDSH